MEVCRICLQYDLEILPIENNLFNMTNKVLPEVCLTRSNKPGACKACADLIDEFYKFKIKCTENEHRIQASSPDQTENICLREALYGVNAGEIVLTLQSKSRICRTCFDSINGESFTILKPSKPDPYLNTMLTSLSELHLELCQDPVMCKKCLDCLQRFHHFKTQSSDVEDKLTNYLLNQGANIKSEINLSKVLDSFPKLSCIKMEHVKLEEPELILPENIKEEELDIIPEEELDLTSEESPELDGSINEKNEDPRESKLNEIMLEVKKNHQEERHYSCGECSFAMADKKHYIMHILSIHTTYNDDDRLLHFCHLCDFKTIYKAQMRKHVSSDHIGKEKLSCPFCAFSSFYPLNLKRHIALHQDLQNLYCSFPKCDFKTAYKHSLQRHEIKIHGNQCNLCTFKDRNATTILRHLRTAHGQYYIHKCDKCEFKTFYLRTLKRHNVRIHKSKCTFTSVRKNKNELTPEEEEEIESLCRNKCYRSHKI